MPGTRHAGSVASLVDVLLFDHSIWRCRSLSSSCSKSHDNISRTDLSRRRYRLRRRRSILHRIY